jgi:hypothetical protein
MLTYHDAYLAPLIAATPEWETRAAEDVAQLGSFPAPWPDKLTVLRAYILCCLESSASPEDVFSLKLKAYQTEWKETLRQAQAAVNVAADQPALSLFIPLERA